ncbi:polysaccharide deacetylase family protein [Thermaerobacter sp. PB12/4term]|uniref:polysaccharide deacetylase family protein n=1 Tax=Thermaerobacter sp. PB12/4term TaxID=2293838 RepID=UPI000E32742B|nr:polysaccharide deacetylase family protein [Thermaerobacter sp. PB12/4term]QIA26488.1 polysaccharide deacetylase family protein [Thermaerobacter sp. PB12/4term]
MAAGGRGRRGPAGARRWWWAAGWILLIAAAMALGKAGWSPFRLLPWSGRSDGLPARVAPDVWVGPVAVGGWPRQQVESWLAGLAGQVAMPPEDARLDPANRAVIPGAAGLALDVPASLEAILRAPRGSRVDLAFRALPPRQDLDDFPAGPVYHGNRRKQVVTFLVNVAWGEEYLPAMLDALAQGGARVTFFPVGRWAESHPDLVAAMARGGHELGNHGYSDALDLEGAPAETVLADLRRGAEAVARAAGVDPASIRFYSTHRGVRTAAVEQAAAAAGVRLIYWSLDTVDWMKPAPEAMARRIVTQAQPGDLILMHPTAVTVQALPAMVQGLQRRGLAIVPLGELLSPLPAGEADPAFRPLVPPGPVLAGRFDPPPFGPDPAGPGRAEEGLLSAPPAPSLR